jgi:flagellar hook-associated protein 1 FlgK
MANILRTGISALNAFQQQLATTGHNIANVNTEGYSRQRVEFGTKDAQPGSTGYIGSGVEVTSIRRSYDNFLATQVRSYKSSQQEYAVYYNRADQINNVIGDESSGISQMMQEFFAGVQDVSADPTSIPARTVLLNRAGALVDRFHSLDAYMTDLRSQIGRDFTNYVSEITSISQSVANINQRIQAAGASSANPPNDLLDQRDHLIDQLSEYVNVSTVSQDDGSLNVFMGSGQALVIGSTTNALSVTNNLEASDQQELAINVTGGGTTQITDQVTGGKLGGLLRFRKEVLDPAQNSLGLVAIGLADAFNAQHQLGMDLDGDLGQDFFSMGSPEVLANPSNSGSVSASFDNVADLTNHEYQLSYDGATWSMLDLTTGGAVSMSGSGTVADPFLADGVALVVGGGAVAGDRYRLRPTRSGADAIDTTIANARDVAAADPLQTQTGGANTGTGAIGGGALVSRTGSTKLAAPVTLTYDSGANVFNLSTGGSVPYDPTTDSGNTLTVTIAGLGDFSFSMTGSPANGDQFSLADNTGGVGDNRNAVRLGDVQSSQVLFGGSASISDAYGYLVADVGTQPHQANAHADAQQQWLTQVESAQSAVSGVNLDEEAADLVRFQQAYSAAAQVIATANTLFDTLLGAVRG